MIANRNQNGPNGKLDFADILSYDDREIYNQLQTEVSDSQNRYNRNHKVQTLNNILEKVLSFCERNENDKWKRYLACGICKLIISNSDHLFPKVNQQSMIHYQKWVMYQFQTKEMPLFF